MVVDKHITVNKRHEQFIDAHNLALSSFVRDRLDEEMAQRGVAGQFSETGATTK